MYSYLFIDCCYDVFFIRRNFCFSYFLIFNIFGFNILIFGYSEYFGGLGMFQGNFVFFVVLVVVVVIVTVIVIVTVSMVVI